MTPPLTPIALSTNGPRVAAAAVGTFTAADLGALLEGSHTLYVQGLDAAGFWGAPTATTFAIDKTAPRRRRSC